jgi:predicted MFS family arabinose efflux permease
MRCCQAVAEPLGLFLVRSFGDRELIKLTPMIVLAVVGNSVLYLVPLLLGAMVTDRGFSEVQAGFLASADLCGFALSTLLTAFLVDRLRQRDIAIAGALIMIVANSLTTGVHALTPFAAVRFVSGFGCGFLVAISSVALGREEKPDRNFGLFYAASLLFSTVTFWVLPPIIDVFKLNSVYWLLATLALISMPFAMALPERGPPLRDSGTVSGQQRWLLAGTMLVTVVTFLAQQGALWAYLERIGNRAGLSSVFIGFTLGCATLTGFAGASMVAWAGSRFDRRMLLLVTMVVEILALGALFGRPGAAMFLVANTILALFWNIVNPLQLGILADVDATGKALALAATATGTGMALGPSIGAVTLNVQGYEVLLVTVGALTVLSVGLMIAVLRAGTFRREAMAP